MHVFAPPHWLHFLGPLTTSILIYNLWLYTWCTQAMTPRLRCAAGLAMAMNGLLNRPTGPKRSGPLRFHLQNVPERDPYQPQRCTKCPQ